MVDRTARSSPLKTLTGRMERSTSSHRLQRVAQFISSRPRYRRRSQSPRSHYYYFYPRVEKCTMVILLIIAWGWVLVTVAMLAWYHQGIAGFPVIFRYRLPVSPEAAAVRGSATLQDSAVPEKHHPHLSLSASSSTLIAAAAAHAPLLSSSYWAADFKPFSSPLIVFTCKRPDYLRQTLDDIYKYRDTSCRMGCPLIISQDGKDPQVEQVILEYVDTFAAVGVPVIYLHHKSTMLRQQQNAYHALAAHYGWALGQVFSDELKFSQSPDATELRLIADRIIILEEDLHIAVDFFQYFAAMASLLDRDSSLLAVSAFNDNGLEGHVSDPTRVLRSDFFPGLGWMMTRKLWQEELQSKWPAGYWDDWLREPSQRQGRHILRPEISRTFHFGTRGGASSNQFGSNLSRVQLNTQPVDWTKYDVANSLLMDQFDQQYWPMVQTARLVQSVVEAQSVINDGNVRLEYHSLKDFAQLARQLGLMTDEKAGVPRTAYKGVVETRLNGRNLLFLTLPMEELQQNFAHVII